MEQNVILFIVSFSVLPPLIMVGLSTDTDKKVITSLRWLGILIRG